MIDEALFNVWREGISLSPQLLDEPIERCGHDERHELEFSFFADLLASKKALFIKQL
jgi:hypothetical protein